ncbi:MAG: cell division ATP-binding protein FtsE [Alphaproteobacteria bacterium]|nr:cell division ATP-binding protein FtsE [Alphaproteobacteria bacterium]
MVRFQSVSLRYGNRPQVLRDVTFHLETGSFHFLVGPSGAGKTSLLRLMFLARRPTRGAITMFGRDLSKTPRHELPALRRRIGIVFQDFRLLDHLTVVDNIALPLRIAGIRDGVVREHVTELLTWVGLTHHADSKPTILSDGEKQRVAIARAVIARPSLLLADEPTGNLDPDLGLRLTQLFAELNKIGTTVVMATHNESLAVRFPFATLQIAEGQVTQGGRRVAPLI